MAQVNERALEMSDADLVALALPTTMARSWCIPACGGKRAHAALGVVLRSVLGIRQWVLGEA